jgi:FkbM family methyltransferase
MKIKMDIASVKLLVRMVIGVFEIQENLLNSIRNKKAQVKYNNLSYTLSVPNKLCKMRAETFSTKEPDTLNWIDGFPEGSILWDIGANVGLYSIHAAKARKCIVYSFEPSVFNLEVLARNISLNDLDSLVTIMPFALNDKMGRGNLSMSSANWGGALSTFDKTYGMDGEDFKVVFKYPIFSLTMDDVINRLELKHPDYLKIDVDGIEQLILAGGPGVLKNVKGVLIELPNLWPEQTRLCEEFLSKAGLVKIQDNIWHPENNPGGTPNQIWARSPNN